MQKNYFSFAWIKNFACVEVHTKTHSLLVYVKAITRDVSDIKHFGTDKDDRWSPIFRRAAPQDELNRQRDIRPPPAHLERQRRW